MACSGDSEPPTEPPQPPTRVPTSVTVSPGTGVLSALGESVQLSAEVSDQNGATMAGASVSWSSSSSSVATVSGTGLVTAVANGTATITATAGSASGSSTITVEQAAATVTISPASLTLNAIGDTATLTATVTDANGSEIADVPVAWATSDGSVATVDSDGQVTAVGVGEALVTAASGSVEASAEITVTPVAHSISVQPTELAFSAIGDTATLTATVADANGNEIANAPVTWTSNDASVATVNSDGLVTAVGVGEASVTATSGSVEAKGAIIVTQAAHSISVEPTEVAFSAIGDTAPLTATVADANGNEIANAPVAWATSDGSVATVNSDGLVTAAGVGEALVTATSGSVEASADITVTQVARSISVEPTELAFSAIGDTATITATVTDANGNGIANAPVAWATSDGSVATVNADGLVTAFGIGEALVTAASGSVEASAEITVTPAARSISVEPTELAFSAIGNTATITATVTDANGNGIANAPVAWGTSDGSVATVNSDGLVTAVGVGEASVSATSGGVEASADITVTQAAHSLSVQPTELVFSAVGDTTTLTATVTDANGNEIANAPVAWATSDGSVATVNSDGLVTAVGVGQASATATSKDLEAGADITVEQVAHSISVQPTELAFSAIGDTATVVATVADANGYEIANAPVTWVTSDGSVATVNSDGLVSAVGVGKASVTATSGGVEAGANITVTPSAHSVSVQPTELAFSAIGDTATLTATVADANGNEIANAGVAWATSDRSVAAVSPGGLVTALGVGQASVTATSGSVEASADITVTQAVHSISVQPTELAFSAIGDTATLTATVTDSNGYGIANAPVAWATIDGSVATVDSTGLVTAVGVGEASVTATSGSVEASANITVEQVARSISVQPTEVTFSAIGDTATLTATVTDSNGNEIANASVAWATSDGSVATVDSTGLVTAVGVGEASVTATSGSVEASVDITVAQAVHSLSVHPTELGFSAIGDRATLVATATDVNGNEIANAPVVWTTSDTSVATVDSAGLVTAAGVGEASVTATSGDIEASADVTVTQVAHSISVEPANLRLIALGDTARVFATVLDTNGNRADAATVSWTSADSAVVAVADGRVLAVGPGTTTVTATSGSVSATVDVEVVQVPATVLVSPESMAFAAVRDTATATATVADANGNEIADAFVAWTTSDASVATVNSGGLITATGIGSTVVTARSDSVSGSASVRVFDVSSDRRMLEYLFHAMGGKGWINSTGWLSDEPLSQWFGIGTDWQGRVNTLELRGNNLTGQIPAVIQNLDRVLTLDLSGNHLTGTIPAEIGNMNWMRDLLLGDNPLEGEIPPELGGLPRLTYLHLGNTNLGGLLPENFAYLRLNVFYFHSTLLCVPRSLKFWLNRIPHRSEDADPLCVPVTADRAVLVKLYEATGGENWERSKGWLSGSGINRWEGVDVNEDGYVTLLALPANNLMGTIPPRGRRLGASRTALPIR